MIYYELLDDGTIGRSTNNINVAKLNGYFNPNNVVEREEYIIYAYNNKRYLKGNEPQKPQELIEKENNDKRVEEIKLRLNELSQDFIQIQVGAIFDDIEERKQEFQMLHNELRGLLGKEPRTYNTNVKEEV